jgi:predicted dehydrogenase
LERSTAGELSEGSEPARTRVGVIGCGLVAQVMHLPYLAELSSDFEVASLCDLSRTALEAAGSRFPAARRFTDWNQLLAETGSLDALLVLTPGSHAPIAVAAAEAGLHVFVEKPMCLSVDEGLGMIEAAERAGVCLMVGYMKRYDPAYERLAGALPEPIRLARSTTLESPLDPYVAHYPLVQAADVDDELLAELAEEDERRVSAAIGTDDPLLRRAYRTILLDSMVHELNAVRGLLGEPGELRFAEVWPEAAGVHAVLSFDEATATFTWVDLPGIARYEGELALYAPMERAVLSFPSPFLRSMPTRLVLEGGVPETADSWRTEHTVSYEEAFKLELLELRASIVERRAPLTSGHDAIRDVALCQSIVRFCLDGRPVPSPSDPELHASRAVH